jgi:hypothetical protein
MVEGPENPAGELCCISGVYIFSAPDDNYNYWMSCYPYSTPEICNGLDDDGDGTVDGITQSCGTNVGICTTGTKVCTNGVWGSCSGTTPNDETCNDLDDDCDGIVDEGCFVGEVYDGYNPYCENIYLSTASDLNVYGHFQSINDSYFRVFMASLDCSYALGWRCWLNSGCSEFGYNSQCEEGGRACLMGIGSSDTYAYSFDSVPSGAHTVCLWPNSWRGDLWNISMTYDTGTCDLTGDDCELFVPINCNEWLCRGYCDYTNECAYIADYERYYTSDPTGTTCCAYSPDGPPPGSFSLDGGVSFIPSSTTTTYYWD